MAIGALSRAGQRNSGIEASWFSSVEACLRARRMLVLKNEAIYSVGPRLSCGDATMQLDTAYDVILGGPHSQPFGQKNYHGGCRS